MTEMEQHAFNRALNTLKALKCEFAVITPSGEKHGELSVEKPNEKRRHKHKGVFKHITTYARPLDVGQEVSIPCNDVPISIMQSRICNWFGKHRGAGSVLTRQNLDINAVTVMRVA